MYVSPTSIRLRLGKSTPAILAKANPPFLSLPLFVSLILADYPDNSFSANDLTLGAYFLNRCSYFHSKYSFKRVSAKRDQPYKNNLYP
jgi:hypothetical protein